MGIFDFWSSPSSTAVSAPAPALPPPAPATETKVQTNDKLKSELNPEGIKPCCACPTTKSLRDSCFLSSGLDPTTDAGQEHCREFVDRHRECMRGYGFKV